MINDDMKLIFMVMKLFKWPIKKLKDVEKKTDEKLQNVETLQKIMKFSNFEKKRFSNVKMYVE